MIVGSEDLRQVLTGTALEGKPVWDVPMCDGEPPALELRGIAVDEAKASLEIGRRFVNETGRWPVLSADFMGPTEQQWRFPGEFTSYVKEGEEVTPAAITARALALDLDKALAERSNRHRADLNDLAAWTARDPARRLAADQLRSAAGAGEVTTFGDGERWLLDWEVTHTRPTNDEIQQIRQGSLDYWHRELSFRLLLLPTAEPWRTTSYLDLFGSGGEFATALLKRWYERWGAVAVTHHGTMMNFEVVDPPSGIADVVGLAWEH